MVLFQGEKDEQITFTGHPTSNTIFAYLYFIQLFKCPYKVDIFPSFETGVFETEPGTYLINRRELERCVLCRIFPQAIGFLTEDSGFLGEGYS